MTDEAIEYLTSHFGNGCRIHTIPALEAVRGRRARLLFIDKYAEESVATQIDTAMTELRKVTDLTEQVYDNVFTEAISRAKQLGASVADTITATADFARLGYGIKDASSNVIRNVFESIENSVCENGLLIQFEDESKYNTVVRTEEDKNEYISDDTIKEIQDNLIKILEYK